MSGERDSSIGNGNSLSDYFRQRREAVIAEIKQGVTLRQSNAPETQHAVRQLEADRNTLKKPAFHRIPTVGDLSRRY